MWQQVLLSDMLKHKESPAKSQRKVVLRISCFIEGGYTNELCVSRPSSEKIYSTERRKIGVRSHRKILQKHLAPNSNSGKKGPSRKIIPKCAHHERSPCPRKFGERSHEETLHQERYARGAAWDVAKIYKLKNADKATFETSIEARAMLAPTSERPEEREIVVESGASMHMLSKKK